MEWVKTFRDCWDGMNVYCMWEGHELWGPSTECYSSTSSFEMPDPQGYSIKQWVFWNKSWNGLRVHKSKILWSSLLAPLSREDTATKHGLWNQRAPSALWDRAGVCILSVQPPEMWEVHLLLISCLVCSMLLRQPRQPKILPLRLWIWGSS